jgi:hypothetical protein
VAVALAAGGVAIAAVDLWLAVVSWRRRSVLPGLLGVAGIALAASAIASGTTSSVGEGCLAVAVIFTIVGGALFALGQAFERLLGDEPEKGDGGVAQR